MIPNCINSNHYRREDGYNGVVYDYIDSVSQLFPFATTCVTFVSSDAERLGPDDQRCLLQPGGSPQSITSHQH